MNKVSIPDSCRFICAICSSFSKSDTARKPLTMADAPTSRATSTTNVVTATMRTLGRCTTASRSISSRSGRVNSGSAFCGLRRIATTTSSKSRPARSTTSRWPLWKGSNEPGMRATVTGCLSGRRARNGPALGTVGPSHDRDERTAVALVLDHFPRWLDLYRSRGLEDGDRGAEMGQDGRPLLEAVRRVAQGQVGTVEPAGEPRDGVAADDGRPVGHAQAVEVGPDDGHRGRVALHEDGRGGPARQGFDAHGAAPGEEVEHRQTVEVEHAAEHVEDGLADP